MLFSANFNTKGNIRAVLNLLRHLIFLPLQLQMNHHETIERTLNYILLPLMYFEKQLQA